MGKNKSMEEFNLLDLDGMIRRGGSFESKLAELYLAADCSNRAILQRSFGGVFAKFKYKKNKNG